MQVAQELRPAGIEPTVVTARWNRAWPRQVILPQAPVARLRTAPRGGLATLRHYYAMSKWLTEHSQDFDAVLVSSLRHDAYAALNSLQGAIPVIVQAETAGPEGDVAWLGRAAFGRRIGARCREADAIIAPSQCVEAELLEKGFPADRIRLIRRGAQAPPARSPLARQSVREALAAVNQDLVAESSQTVALCIARFEPHEGLPDLVRGWVYVASRWPTARLWIVGDGPLRESLYRLISDLDLRYRVVMPGIFSEHDDLLQAADIYVQPATADCSTLRLMHAMAAGLPVIAANLPGNRELITGDEDGLMVQPGDAKSLGAAIDMLIRLPGRAVELGEAARKAVRSRWPLSNTVQQYAHLLHQLVKAKRNA